MYVEKHTHIDLLSSARGQAARAAEISVLRFLPLAPPPTPRLLPSVKNKEFPVFRKRRGRKALDYDKQEKQRYKGSGSREDDKRG